MYLSDLFHASHALNQHFSFSVYIVIGLCNVAAIDKVAFNRSVYGTEYSRDIYNNTMAAHEARFSKAVVPLLLTWSNLNPSKDK